MTAAVSDGDDVIHFKLRVRPRRAAVGTPEAISLHDPDPNRGAGRVNSFLHTTLLNRTRLLASGYSTPSTLKTEDATITHFSFTFPVMR